MNIEDGLSTVFVAKAISENADFTPITFEFSEESLKAIPKESENESVGLTLRQDYFGEEEAKAEIGRLFLKN